MASGRKLDRTAGSAFLGATGGASRADRTRPGKANKVRGKVPQLVDALTPYQQGQLAARAGETEGRCPYDRNGGAAEAWLAGYRGE